MRLSDVAIRKAKPTAKPYKLADGGGMYLRVNPTGSKLGAGRTASRGKEKLLALGAYPEQSLIAARTACPEARSKLKQGIDASAASLVNISDRSNVTVKRRPLMGGRHAELEKSVSRCAGADLQAIPSASGRERKCRDPQAPAPSQ
jgi:hypothetical protein